MIAEIRHATGLPVVTRNAALLHMVLRKLNWPDGMSGFGRVLAGG